MPLSPNSTTCVSANKQKAQNSCWVRTSLQTASFVVPGTADVGIQGTRSYSTIQGDGKAGRIPGSPLFTVVLTSEAVPAGPPLRIQVSEVSSVHPQNCVSSSTASGLRQKNATDTEQRHQKYIQTKKRVRVALAVPPLTDKSFHCDGDSWSSPGGLQIGEANDRF